MCFCCYDPWKAEGWFSLARQPASSVICFFWKLQPMVYAPYHTQSGYNTNCRVILANRWPLVLLATGDKIKTPLKNTIVRGFSDSPDSVTPGHCILQLIDPCRTQWPPCNLSVHMYHGTVAYQPLSNWDLLVINGHFNCGLFSVAFVAAGDKNIQSRPDARGIAILWGVKLDLPIW